ncbi:MAG TPA: glycine--tRNA ligase [Clostridiales bacterium]|nr:MAG: glycine--tRNA ligase [Clostridiales bacterium GWD2_32_59]HAN09688.1 glycine--tRNA ligase [Clostridiales bacterium]
MEKVESKEIIVEEEKFKVEMTMDKLVALAKNRGFVYPGSDIYGGLANTWDYGPLGVELKNNIKKAWWKKFIQQNQYNVGMDAAILMNPEVWVASGHVNKATDPLMDCKECHERFRADKLVKQYLNENDIKVEKSPDAWTEKELEDFIKENQIKCPSCAATNFTNIRQFNIMFKTFQGVTEDNKNTVYLRPETAQGIFVNFKNVQRSARKKIPFGIGQIGKAFRNEITPGNFIFRTREFEQMELEFFCKAEEDLTWFSYWKEFCMKWLFDLGMKTDNVRFYDQSKEELTHYSKATSDIEFRFPFGWDEIWGIADRTDFDLKNHAENSGEDMSYFDQETKEKYIPYCIEPSLGADRVTLAFLCNAYDEELVLEGDVRTVLRLHPFLAPIKIGIFPLSKKLEEGTKNVFEKMSALYNVEYDDTGSIGKRYRRQDEIGTPFCITYDFESENDKCVTVRHRDSMLQERIKIEELEGYFKERLDF